MLRSSISLDWAVIAIALAAFVVGAWITTLAIRLSSARNEGTAASTPLPYAVAEMRREGGALIVEIQGSPGATAILLADGEPILTIPLNAQGRGTVADPRITDGTRLEIATIAEAPDAIAPLPTLTPTATATATASVTATATATVPAVATQETPAIVAIPTTRSVSETRVAPPSETPAPAATSRHPKTKFEPEPGDRLTPSPPVLHLVTDAGSRIAITFDGNASSNGTAKLLDLLQDLDLKITLFVTGGFVERYPTLVRRAVLAGHEVGSHSYSHPHLTTYADNHRHDILPDVDREMLHSQLRRTEEAFRKATGRSMAPLWRAPFGEENATLRGWAMEMGYLHVRWSSLEGRSLDSLDWIADEHSKLYRDSQRMVDRLLGFPRLEGGIVLMHLSTEREEPPWSDLPRFVAELRRRGIEPVKVSDMLRRSKTWRPWFERAQQRHDELFGKE